MSKSIHFGNLYVVLVEPSTTQFHIISDYLKNLGVEYISHVESGTAALEKMNNDRPDLVISAMHLPDMTGTELVTRMRKDENLGDIGFILISSETHYSFLEPIRQAGVVAIVPKPFEQKQLERALNAALDFIEADGIELGSFDVEEMAVLIVDDSSLAQRHIVRTLNALGMINITTVNDGQEAVDVINQQYFDLIVTDYHMPAMDGGELVRYIRNNSNQPSVPILMVTSEANKSELAAIEQAGVSAICGKPFDIENVRLLISKVLS